MAQGTFLSSRGLNLNLQDLVFALDRLDPKMEASVGLAFSVDIVSKAPLVLS